jgi:hypothetical protein
VRIALADENPCPSAVQAVQPFVPMKDQPVHERTCMTITALANIIDSMFRHQRVVVTALCGPSQGTGRTHTETGNDQESDLG